MRKTAKALTLLVTALLLCLVLSAGALAADASGTCGENLTWELTDGVLTINGAGDMYDYNPADPVPWLSYRNSITSIVIDSEVTSLGTTPLPAARVFAPSASTAP